MIDLLINMSEIYGQPNENDESTDESEIPMINGNHSYSNSKI
jgi:hypothetical protein